MQSIDAFFTELWDAYIAITPQAGRVKALLTARGERFLNDHVAFRTFDRAPINLEALTAPFESWGYLRTGAYHFEQKCLSAVSLSHPSGEYPRVFLSELISTSFSHELQQIVYDLCGKVDPSTTVNDRLLGEGGWPAPDFPTYEQLAKESEYAAWVAAFGLRANHFTVSVNALEGFDDIADLNAFLEDNGMVLNESGGKIKGGRGSYLAQSSTMADRVLWGFSQGQERRIPSCYVEFAYRYALPEGGLFDGFVTQSADRIFESTDT